MEPQSAEAWPTQPPVDQFTQQSPPQEAWQGKRSEQETVQLEQQPAEAWPTKHWAEQNQGEAFPRAVQVGEEVPEANPTSYPWRQAQGPPPKRSRVAAERGVLTTWRQERYGFARFLGYDERVLVHQSDCDQALKVGDAVTGHLHRRRDGKLQCFKVLKIVAESPLDARVHDALLGLA